jgi:hypothetical protein
VQALEVMPGVGILGIMTKGENEFELTPGRIRHDRPATLAGVRAKVRQRIGATAGPKTLIAPKARVAPKTRIAPKTGIRAHFRKGSAGRARPVIPTQRRVVVKARYAMHSASKGAPLRAHLSYLARDGKAAGRGEPGLERSVDYLQRTDTPGNERFAFYDRSELAVDGKAVTAGWAEDSRHFRLIISAEDGEGLGDLKPFVREVMSGLERQLGTKLEWLAVDHWDTDNPHTHVLIRGRRADGQDLFIPSRLISSGIREHAQEVVTRLLGPRLESDLWRDHWREVSRMTVTPLDRELIASLDGEGIVHVYQPHLIARLERLEAWDLAERARDGWRISDNLIGELRSIDEHQAIERAVSTHRRPGELLPLLAAAPEEAIEGQLVHYGPADDMGDIFLAVIETGRGELRYARIAREADQLTLDGVVSGSIVTLEPNVPAPKPADHAIAAIAEKTGGLYSAEHHRWASYRVSDSLIEANIRRLEAMRRMSLISRDANGVFLVGHDHLARAMLFDERLSRRYPMIAGVASYWTLEEQVTAIGPTRLDRVLAGEVAQPEGEGAFARQYASALQQRRLFLIEQGWLGRDQSVLPQSTLSWLATNEVRAAADDLRAEIGKPVLTVRLNQIQGVYARRIDLAQGRMALIDAGRHAVLVDWRPVLERFGGRQVEGVLRGRGISWSLQRGRGIDLPPM